MAKNKFVTEGEFNAIKTLMANYSNAEIASFCRAGLIERSDTTLGEIRKAEDFKAYQTRYAEPKAAVIINGVKFEGTITECQDRLDEARKNMCRRG